MAASVPAESYWMTTGATKTKTPVCPQSTDYLCKILEMAWKDVDGIPINGLLNTQRLDINGVMRVEVKKYQGLGFWAFRYYGTITYR